MEEVSSSSFLQPVSPVYFFIVKRPGNWILLCSDFLLLLSFNQTDSRAPEQILGMLDNIQAREQPGGEMLVQGLFVTGTTLYALRVQTRKLVPSASTSKG